jgi:hypothetical protein
MMKFACNRLVRIAVAILAASPGCAGFQIGLFGSTMRSTLRQPFILRSSSGSGNDGQENNSSGTDGQEGNIKFTQLSEMPQFPKFDEVRFVSDTVEAIDQPDSDPNVLYVSTNSKIKQCLRQDDDGKYFLDFSLLDLSEITDEEESEQGSSDDTTGTVALPSCVDSQFEEDPLVAVARPTAKPFVLYCPYHEGEGTVTGIFKDDKGKIYATKAMVEQTHDFELAKILYEKFGAAVTLYYCVPDFIFETFTMKDADAPTLGTPCPISYLKIPRPTLL